MCGLTCCCTIIANQRSLQRYWLTVSNAIEQPQKYASRKIGRQCVQNHRAGRNMIFWVPDYSYFVLEVNHLVCVPRCKPQELLIEPS